MWRERSKQDRHETPSGTGYDRNGASLADTSTLWDAHRNPENDYEGMVVGFPGVSQETLDANWDMFQQIIDGADLGDKEQAVFDMIVFGQMSLAQVGYELGVQFRNEPEPFSKTMVAKLRDSAIDKVRQSFHDYMERINQ